VNRPSSKGSKLLFPVIKANKIKGHLLLALGFFFHRKRDRGDICIFSMLTGGWSVCVCVCVHTRAHTHTACRAIRCEHRGRDETLGDSREYRWTKSRHIFNRICVKRTHAYAYAGKRDEIWTDCFFPF